MNSKKPAKSSVAVLGGTGAEGSGLAYRWALAGYDVVIGSRNAEKALEMAHELNTLLGEECIRGMSNRDAAGVAEIAVLTVPFSVQRATAIELKDLLSGKILVDVTVPLVPPKVDHVNLPAGGSAVASLQAELGADVKVVSAFQNVSAHHLKDQHHKIDCDVLVCGDDKDARQVVVELASDAGFRAFHAGPICNSAAVEAMTSLLIFMNKRYKVPGAGVRITGIEALD